MIAAAPHWRFPQIRCAYCRVYPCECRPLARTGCVCGAVLEADDDLESKRAAHETHVRSTRHADWQAGR